MISLPYLTLFHSTLSICAKSWFLPSLEEEAASGLLGNLDPHSHHLCNTVLTGPITPRAPEVWLPCDLLVFAARLLNVFVKICSTWGVCVCERESHNFSLSSSHPPLSLDLSPFQTRRTTESPESSDFSLVPSLGFTHLRLRDKCRGGHNPSSNTTYPESRISYPAGSP